MPSPFETLDPDAPWELPDGSTYDPGTQKREPPAPEEDGCLKTATVATVLLAGVLLLAGCGLKEQAIEAGLCMSMLPGLLVGVGIAVRGVAWP